MTSIIIGLGEFIDRISILLIKIDKLKDEKKDIARNELAKLDFTWDDLSKTYPGILAHHDKLRHVNTQLWEIEDSIRKADASLFGGSPDTSPTELLRFDADDLCSFIKLARSVYQLNDERYRIKNYIDTTYGIGTTEVKSYVK